MTLDPQIATLATLTMAVGFTMSYAALKKNLLELKQRKRICPACGRTIPGRRCHAH
jgi:hypothetical protein